MTGLYDVIEFLCKRNGIRISEMCNAIGMRRGLITDLKYGRTKNLSYQNLLKIATYFNVSTDVFRPETPVQDFMKGEFTMYECRKRPTMTIGEMCEALRANVIPCSDSIIGDMIIDGKFPFAVGHYGSGKNVYIIFRSGFYKWLDEMMGEKAVRYDGG